MADNQHYYGFRWHKSAGGRDCPQGIVMVVADSYSGQADGAGSTVPLGVGDPVKLVSTGTVALANTTDKVYGIVVAVHGYWSTSESAYRTGPFIPAATTGGAIEDRLSRVVVVPASWGLWEVDVDDAVTATDKAGYRAFVGENVEHTCAGASINGVTRADPRLDISGHATTAGHGWRIMAISRSAANKDFSGANVKLVVAINDTNLPSSPATNEAGV